MWHTRTRRVFLQTQSKKRGGKSFSCPLEIEPIQKYIWGKKKGHNLKDGKFELVTQEKILHHSGWSNREMA